MIVILKSGNPKQYKFECQNCGCVFTCHETDLSHVCENIYTNTITHYHIKCPDCNAPIEIKADNLRRYVY